MLVVCTYSIVNVSWLPIRQQCLTDFFSHRPLLHIGCRILEIERQQQKKLKNTTRRHSLLVSHLQKANHLFSWANYCILHLK